MIQIDEFAKTLEDLLNGTYTPSTETKPNDLLFRVQTFGSNLDKVSDEKARENFIPVLVSDVSGSVTPIPNVQMSAYTFIVNFYCPFYLKDDIFRMFEYLQKQIVGKVINFSKDENGNVLEKGVCNMSLPSVERTTQQVMQQFYRFMDEVFNQEIIVTDNWLIYSLEIYVTTAGKTSNGDNLVFGNEVSYQLSVREPNGTLHNSDTLIRNEVSNSLENAFNSQQLLKNAFATSLISATAYSFAINCYITDSDFWQTLLWYHSQKRFNELEFNLTRSFRLGKTIILRHDPVLVNMDINEPLGDFMSVSLSFALKGDDE